MQSKTVLVSVINDLNTDQRVHKICTFIEQQGYRVVLIGRKTKRSAPMEERSYQTIRMKLLFEKGGLFYAEFNLRLFFLLLFKRSHTLVANDLDTLLANFLVAKLKRKKLVYDSHEFFTEVPELLNRPKIRAVWLAIERFIFPTLTHISTVNNSIANEYKKRYAKELTVVRNVSPLWQSTTVVPSKEELGIPRDKNVLIMQGAGLNVDRGVEEAIRMMPLLTNSVLLIVGDGDVIPDMKRLVKENNWENLVLFFGKRPYKEMMNYTFHADLGLSFDQPTNPNYKLSLPNKLFDYIHTTTPVICSNVIEVATLVNNYQIGTVVTDFSPDGLAKVINPILANKDVIASWEKNCQVAAETENWQIESQKLIEFYPKIGK
jgi:glycosyltransferase involved in cell wall biosynthesis